MTKSQVMDKLKVQTDLGLLEHLPARYDDMTPTAVKSPDSYAEGEKVRLFVRVMQVKTNLKARIIRFTARDQDRGCLGDFIVFGQLFYLNRIAVGRELFAVAYFKKRLKAFVVSAVYERDSRFVRAGVRPVYRLPKDISQTAFWSVIARILTSPAMLYVKDAVPEVFVTRYRLLPRAKAFAYVHDPHNRRELEEGIRTFKFEECLAYCLRIKGNRRYLSLLKKNTTVPIDTAKVNAFVLSLPFKLTRDQVKAVREIVLDMDSAKVMYRLLQGDVSTGKTAVAAVALYANWLRGGQGVLLAPTAALARQHLSTLQSFFPTGPRTALLEASMAVAAKRAVLASLDQGTTDILVTTQAGLSTQVVYHKLTLAVIDEQQSFGVDQRAAMIAKGQATDTLMMTATPIPRTLAILRTGDMDLSELRQFPGRSTRMVRTAVVRSDDPLIARAIGKALAAGRQVFVVVPRIDDNLDEGESDLQRRSAKEVFGEYAKRYGTARVQLLHGRMKIAEQAKILADFASKAKPILVTTSVVEVGIDIRDAGLMVIYSANLFGLSALHQLRGRIGRNGHFALALLVYDGQDRSAREKLEYLAKTDDGFEISKYDLGSRGAGSIAGLNQSGASDLMIADFATDQAMFEVAMKDADEILDGLDHNPAFRDYAEKILTEDRIRRALVVPEA